MIKCSFCEHPLVCKSCGEPFRPRTGDAHLAVYQPDVAISCPECKNLLVCKDCGFAYGEDEVQDEA